MIPDPLINPAHQLGDILAKSSLQNSFNSLVVWDYFDEWPTSGHIPTFQLLSQAIKLVIPEQQISSASAILQ